MKLKVKDINLSTGGPLVAVLNEEDAIKLDLHALDRVKITRLKTKKSVVAVVDISDRGVDKGEIGLFDEIFKSLHVPEGTNVEVKFVPRPSSVKFIRKKLDGGTLKAAEIHEIIKNVVDNRFSEIELTYFVSGCFTNGLTMKESAALTQAIVDSGTKLNIKSQVILDKHCIGGVPNNRTTMVVVPILAALGYKVPKTSSRAITSPAGTADTMEVLAPVSLTAEKIMKVVKKTNACMVWGGAVNLAAADDLLIRVRHPLRLDPEGMLLASIMAKKKAVGATHVLIDIPYGYGAKIASRKKAEELGEKFQKLAKLLKMKVKVVYTDGSHPIGDGIGPALEAADVLSVLKNDGPNDLREKSIFLATNILTLLNVRNPRAKVLNVLNSGKALEKFKEIIVAQGGRKHIILPKAKYFYEVKSEKRGHVKTIYNKGIAKIARLAGAPQDVAAGMYLRVNPGDKVRKGEVLFTIYAQNKAKLDNTIKCLSRIEAVMIS